MPNVFYKNIIKTREKDIRETGRSRAGERSLPPPRFLHCCEQCPGHCRRRYKLRHDKRARCDVFTCPPSLILSPSGRGFNGLIAVWDGDAHGARSTDALGSSLTHGCLLGSFWFCVNLQMTYDSSCCACLPELILINSRHKQNN